MQFNCPKFLFSYEVIVHNASHGIFHKQYKNNNRKCIYVPLWGVLAVAQISLHSIASVLRLKSQGRGVVLFSVENSLA